MKLLNNVTWTLVFLTLLFGANTLSAIEVNSGGDQPKLTDEDRIELERIEVAVQELFLELSKLKADKKSAPTARKKRAIRKEMRRVKQEMRALEARAQAVSGGIYIGSGALIVILLLILLL